MVLKIAIIGCSESNELAPWNDPLWIKWGLRQDDKNWPLFDVVFEIHRKELLPNWDRVEERIKNIDVPVLMRDDYGLGKSVYPYQAISDIFGWYFTYSVAYMLALAIYKQPEQIGIWGIDMNEDEYFHQRPNFEFLIGYAKGSGIDVFIPDNCPLLKAPLYGY